MTHTPAAPEIVAARRLVRDACHELGALPNHVSHWNPIRLAMAADNVRAGLTTLGHKLAPNEEAAYWRQCAEHAEERAALLSLFTARLLAETHDWAWSLCGEREGLDSLRADCLTALQAHAESGGATTGDFLALLESLKSESLPHLKQAANASR